MSRAGRGGGRLQSSSLLSDGERVPFPRVSCAGARACPGAYRGGAVRAPDCPRARQAQDAPTCRLNRGRSAPGRRGRDAAPDASSLAPIISRVSCFGPKKEKYHLNFMNNLVFASADYRIHAGLHWRRRAPVSLLGGEARRSVWIDCLPTNSCRPCPHFVGRRRPGPRSRPSHNRFGLAERPGDGPR